MWKRENRNGFPRTQKFGTPSAEDPELSEVPSFQGSLFLLMDTTAGKAGWLERRTRDRKIASSNPDRSGRRIFFSRVNFVC